MHIEISVFIMVVDVKARTSALIDASEAQQKQESMHKGYVREYSTRQCYTSCGIASKFMGRYHVK